MFYITPSKQVSVGIYPPRRGFWVTRMASLPWVMVDPQSRVTSAQARVLH